jgi:RNA polymerase sigma-70 factor (ECF subfamily)
MLLSRPAQREGRLTHQPTAGPSAEDLGDVALACKGDGQAFERLYRRHVARIRGLACRMAGVAAADELTQDAFVRAWEKIRTFRGESQFGTWLHRLAVNVILEDRRGVARRRVFQDDASTGIEGASVEPADAAFSIDFEAAVDGLPEGARHVFVLHDIEGYKHHEIAALAGITVGTSKGQLHRARMILRRHLAAGAARRAADGSLP